MHFIRYIVSIALTVSANAVPLESAGLTAARDIIPRQNTPHGECGAMRWILRDYTCDTQWFDVTTCERLHWPTKDGVTFFDVSHACHCQLYSNMKCDYAAGTAIFPESVTKIEAMLVDFNKKTGMDAKYISCWEDD